MSIFSKIFHKQSVEEMPEKHVETKNEKQEEKKPEFISSFRYRGRWYGLMFCLGEQSGRDMNEKMKDKASEVITMLEISNEFPEDFKYVNQLLDLQKKQESKSEHLSLDEQQRDYILGAIEAKQVYYEGKDWSRLLKEEAI